MVIAATPDVAIPVKPPSVSIISPVRFTWSSLCLPTPDNTRAKRPAVRPFGEWYGNPGERRMTGDGARAGTELGWGRSYSGSAPDTSDAWTPAPGRGVPAGRGSASAA